MKLVFHRKVDARAVLRYTVNLTGGTTHLEVGRRRGRTAHWPASLLVTRFGHRPAGLWLRVGARAWWFAVVHRSEPYRYLR